jgi:hypothetical protein
MPYVDLALNKLNTIENSKEGKSVFTGINELGSLRYLTVKTQKQNMERGRV